MWPLQEEWQVHERQHNLLREAEWRHRIELALAGQPPRATRSKRALVWLGQLLSRWGERLQARYQPASIGSHAGNV